MTVARYDNFWQTPPGGSGGARDGLVGVLLCLACPRELASDANATRGTVLDVSGPCGGGAAPSPRRWQAIELATSTPLTAPWCTFLVAKIMFFFEIMFFANKVSSIQMLQLNVLASPISAARKLIISSG